MVFRKRRGRRKKISWRWEGKEIEEIREIKYLDYVFQANGGQEEYIRDRVKRAMGIAGQIWDIGKKESGTNIGKRLWLFDMLV